MKMRSTHICVALLLFPSILVGTAKAEDWNLESYYYSYSGSTTEDFPAPYLGAPECWTVIYDDLNIRATTTWGLQDQETSRVEMRVESNGYPEFTVVNLAIGGEFELPSENSVVDILIQYQFFDNVTGALATYQLFFLEQLFPLSHSDQGPNSGQFWMEREFPFPSTMPPIIGTDVSVRIAFFLVAQGEIFPQTEITITEVQVTPKVIFLCCNSLIGDANFDGRLTFEDIPNFVQEILGMPPFEQASLRVDMNHDGQTDGLDIQAFIDALFNDCMGG